MSTSTSTGANMGARPVGRPRREETDGEILAAAGALLRRYGYAGVTMEAVAAEAGVAKTTLYRRWPSRGALLLDLYMSGFPEPEPADSAVRPAFALASEIVATVERLADPVWAGTLRSLVAEAQSDPAVADALRERVIEPRRARAKAILERLPHLARTADPDIMLDSVFGAIWYRLLLGHAPLDRAFAEKLTRTLVQRPG